MTVSNEDATDILERRTVADGRDVIVVEMTGRKDVTESHSCRNVFCVDPANEIYWQVSPNKPPYEYDNFVGIELDGGKWKGTTFFGWEYDIDLSSDAATMTGWKK
jgi:hypothetical protein